MASVQVKPAEKSDINKVLIQLQELQTTVNELRTSMNELLNKHKLDINNIKSAILEAFDLDFIKQIRYENDVTYKTITLIVIYEHDDCDFAVNTIVNRFGKLEHQLADLYIELLFFDVTRVEQSDIEHTGIIFNREE